MLIYPGVNIFCWPLNILNFIKYTNFSMCHCLQLRNKTMLCKAQKEKQNNWIWFHTFTPFPCSQLVSMLPSNAIICTWCSKITLCFSSNTFNFRDIYIHYLLCIVYNTAFRKYTDGSERKWACCSLRYNPSIFLDRMEEYHRNSYWDISRLRL